MGRAVTINCDGTGNDRRIEASSSAGAITEITIIEIQIMKDIIMRKKTNLRAVETSDTIVPITVGNPNAADDLAIDQTHLEEFATAGSETSAVVECRKPPKGVFFTARPDPEDRGFYFLLQIEGRDPYLIAPAIAKQKQEEDTLRPVLIVRYVTMAGDEGLWPLKLDQTDGKSNAWNTSARIVLESAEGGWVRLVNAKKYYAATASKKTLNQVPPKFTDRTFKELVNAAFKDRTVTTLDHEIWDILDNGSDK
jgi:hypothetical protein